MNVKSRSRWEESKEQGIPYSQRGLHEALVASHVDERQHLGCSHTHIRAVGFCNEMDDAQSLRLRSKTSSESRSNETPVLYFPTCASVHK
eukprot:1161907-Pelagomonas_calceolata.AAC.2